MVGTIFSILIAAFLLFNPIAHHISPEIQSFGFFTTLFAALFLFLFIVGMIISWGPLQRAEQDFTPRVVALFRKDNHLRFAGFWLILFTLLSVFLTADIVYFNIFNKTILFSIGIVLLGISLDVLLYGIKRISSYFDPFQAVQMSSKEAMKCIQDDREGDLCSWIDALTEIALKAITRQSTSLCNNVMNEIQLLTRHFLEASKNISHHDVDSQTKAMGISDKESYVLFYVLQRLEIINQKALENNQESICSGLVTTLGKITIASAKYDLSIVTYPLHFLGKFVHEAFDHNWNDVPLKASLTLMEISKAILNETNIAYADLQEPFSSIVAHLQNIAKETFRLDKRISIKILTQPFRELKEMFLSEKVSNHRDTPVIIHDLDRVLGEFDALETVMKTIPPIPQIFEETKTEISSEITDKNESV